MNLHDLNAQELQKIVKEAEHELYAELRTNIQVIDMIFEYVLWEKQFPDKDQCKDLKKAIKSLKGFLIDINK